MVAVKHHKWVFSASAFFGVLLILIRPDALAEASNATSSGPSSRRSLLPTTAAAQHGAPVSSSASCSRASEQLLTNGYFQPQDTSDMFNVLLMATMSNDIYPFAKQYDNTLLHVVEGLSQQEVLQFQRQFTAKYMQLGAHSVQFQDYYQPEDLGAAGHSAVLGTETDVFVVFRGTSDFGQGLITGKFETRPWVIFSKTLDIYYPVHQSMHGLYPKVLEAVKKAVAATNVPSKAKVYLTGHSLGAASACLGGLLLLDQGFTIGGVWSFDPYMAGTKCDSGGDCWVALYDRYLGDRTWMIWNNQDPIPILTQTHFQVSIQSGERTGEPWGHVPWSRNWMRIVGDQCLSAGGTQLGEACPPEVDAADGKADGKCASTFHDHWPWVVLQHVARCALLQGPPAANARSNAMTGSDRLDGCVRSSVWRVLLGLEPPTAAVLAAERAGTSSVKY